MATLLAGKPSAALTTRISKSPALPSRLRPGAKPSLKLRAVESSGGPSEFNLAEYFEAKVEDVGWAQGQNGHVILLRVLAAQGTSLQLPIYIGEYESQSLHHELHNSHTTHRPASYDLMKNTVLALGFKVSKVAIVALRDNTYLGRVHYTLGRDRKYADFKEIDLDARPSDAINLAVRFGAPVYVNKEVARRMCKTAQQPLRRESQDSVRKSCEREKKRYQDPTCVLRLQQQVAVAEERYDDAARLRDSIEKMMSSNRALSLIVAMDSALEDGRYEEAAKLRDEFKHMMDQLDMMAQGYALSE